MLQCIAHIIEIYCSEGSYFSPAFKPKLSALTFAANAAKNVIVSIYNLILFFFLCLQLKAGSCRNRRRELEIKNLAHQASWCRSSQAASGLRNNLIVLRAVMKCAHKDCSYKWLWSTLWKSINFIWKSVTFWSIDCWFWFVNIPSFCNYRDWPVKLLVIRRTDHLNWLVLHREGRWCQPRHLANRHKFSQLLVPVLPFAWSKW